MKKILVLGIIVLFIGISIAPGITANNSLIKNRSQLTLEKETVDYTVEICGLNGGKQTVELTKKEAEELNILLYSIKIKLESAETSDEIIEVINEALIDLDKLGLIGEVNVEKIIHIINKNVCKKESSNIPNIKYKNLQKNNNRIENYFCLVIGHTSSTWFNTLVMYALEFLVAYLSLLHTLIWAMPDNLKGPLLNFIFEKLEYLIWDVGYPLIFDYDFYIHSNIQPFVVGSQIEYVFSNGWVFSMGLNGIKRINGSIDGLLPGGSGGTVGIKGFTGLKITDNGDPPTCFYLGVALHLKIENYIKKI